MEKELYSQIYQIEKTHWWYVARRKIIFDWVFRALGENSGARILDVGCGTGYNLESVSRCGYPGVYGVDIATEALDFCRSRGFSQVACGDVAQLPYASGTFDLVTALDVIEHLDEDQKGIDELTRVIKPGGNLVLFVPAFQFLWSLQDEVSHHRRRYTASDLKLLIHKAGLEIVKLTYANSLLFPMIWIGRLWLRLVRSWLDVTSENDLSPAWSNAILERIFSAERPMLRRVDFPVGVSVFCVCQKDNRT